MLSSYKSSRSLSHLLMSSCTKASDRQRINTVIDRARRVGYCSPDLLTFDELCDIADDKLFSKLVRQYNYILHPLPPSSTASQRYNLRHRVHSLQLSEHATQLSDSNFLTRNILGHFLRLFDTSGLLYYSYIIRICHVLLFHVVGLHFVMP